MAPRNDRGPHRSAHRPDHGGTERRNRNAYTGAGVNARRSTNGRDGNRRVHYDRYTPRARGGDERARVEHPRGPLVNRMTFPGDLPRARGATGRDRPLRPPPRRGRYVEPQGRIRQRHDEGGGRRDVPQGRHNNNGAQGLSARMTVDGNANDVRMDNNNSQFTTANNATAATQEPSLFYGSQPTQVPNIQISPSPPPPPTAPALRATTFKPIRMFNQPLDEDQPKPKRPINTYRGNDPIKKLVQNPKLRAILSGRGLPKTRKKALDDRPDLRMGVSKITK
ncbi:uncharacterized protein K460DRAFT_405398 [Cucurbitaria berberidis CBS 394.84]|uniref:Uncharacterized protein n=1 Tax=Cucurbitaria berberidis CBS 394.84 TaxID=1168544 RepID=A0A9P4GH36_9PLEO|nr:uncharacterized protein K460DRAFT_405398 [Cucurbitaria berberidis CBS 394.84]KAF1845124.1 hypothetical protein K460DRAFT_405398 [Cucurbitaria berberidis CBS 394.84]